MQGNVSFFPLILCKTERKQRFHFLFTYLSAHNIHKEEIQKRSEEHLCREQTVVSKSSNTVDKLQSIRISDSNYLISLSLDVLKG